VVGVGDLLDHKAAHGVRRGGHLVLKVVGVVPALPACQRHLGGQVALVVVAVDPDAVGHEPVARARHIAAGVAVAGGVVAVALQSLGDELVGVVVGVVGDEAVSVLGDQPVGGVVGVTVGLQRLVGAVAMNDRREAVGVVVVVLGRADEDSAAQHAGGEAELG